jgi:hypothetical protein
MLSIVTDASAEEGRRIDDPLELGAGGDRGLACCHAIKISRN